jgi:hypothetical protein
VEAVAPGFGQAHTIDDRGVIERVGNHRIFGAEQGFENAAIGVKTRAEQDRVVLFEVTGDGLFELLVQLVRATDEANRGHSRAVFFQRPDARFDHFGVISEAEVVVGAQIDHGAAADRNFALLGGSDDHFRLEKSLVANPVEGLAQVLGETVHHDGYSFLLEAVSNILEFASMGIGGPNGDTAARVAERREMRERWG